MNTLYTRRGKTPIVVTKKYHPQSRSLPLDRPLKCYSISECPLYERANERLKQVPFDNYEGGFTLIESLVVGLIIAVLAAVALPQYYKSVEKSRVTEAKIILKAMDQAQQLCFLEHGEHICGSEDFFENSSFVPPGPLQDATDCPEHLVCFKTKDWSFWSEDWLYARRIINGEEVYTLGISTLANEPDITCDDYPKNEGYCAKIGM